MGVGTTDDLVERLREPNEGWCYGCWDDLPEKAADRIEQLEAALRFYAHYSTYQFYGVQMSGASTRPCDIDKGTRAKAALAGEKKDD